MGGEGPLPALLLRHGPPPRALASALAPLPCPPHLLLDLLPPLGPSETRKVKGLPLGHYISRSSCVPWVGS